MFLASNPSWEISSVNNYTFVLVSKFKYKGKVSTYAKCQENIYNSYVVYADIIQGTKSITSIQNLVQDVRWTSNSLRRSQDNRTFFCVVWFERNRRYRYFNQVLIAEGVYITYEHSNVVGMFQTFSICSALKIVHSIDLMLSSIVEYSGQCIHHHINTANYAIDNTPQSPSKNKSLKFTL